jgi:hypothetical protein
MVANDVTTDCNDQKQLIPRVEQTKENLGEIPNKVKADCGYDSQLEDLAKKYPTIDIYIDEKRDLVRTMAYKTKT